MGIPCRHLQRVLLNLKHSTPNDFFDPCVNVAWRYLRKYELGELDDFLADSNLGSVVIDKGLWESVSDSCVVTPATTEVPAAEIAAEIVDDESPLSDPIALTSVQNFRKQGLSGSKRARERRNGGDPAYNEIMDKAGLLYQLAKRDGGEAEVI
jgi:hypothetical protein